MVVRRRARRVRRHDFQDRPHALCLPTIATSPCALAPRALRSALALVSAIEHFKAKGIEVHAILPSWAIDGGREKRCALRLSRSEELKPYLTKVLHLAPAGIDEDDFVLQLALERDAAILSNDLFRDKPFVPRDWLKQHRIGCARAPLPLSFFPFSPQPRLQPTALPCAVMFVDDSLLVHPSAAIGDFSAPPPSRTLNPPTTPRWQRPNAPKPATTMKPRPIDSTLAPSPSMNLAEEEKTKPRACPRKRRAPVPDRSLDMDRGGARRRSSGPSMKELLSRAVSARKPKLA